MTSAVDEAGPPRRGRWRSPASGPTMPCSRMSIITRELFNRSRLIWLHLRGSPRRTNERSVRLPYDRPYIVEVPRDTVGRWYQLLSLVRLRGFLTGRRSLFVRLPGTGHVPEAAVLRHAGSLLANFAA